MAKGIVQDILKPFQSFCILALVNCRMMPRIGIAGNHLLPSGWNVFDGFKRRHSRVLATLKKNFAFFVARSGHFLAPDGLYRRRCGVVGWLISLKQDQHTDVRGVRCKPLAPKTLLLPGVAHAFLSPWQPPPLFNLCRVPIYHGSDHRQSSWNLVMSVKL